MTTTLVFPSYLHLAGFISVADAIDINMDLQTRSLTATFDEKQIELAISSFEAKLS